MDTHLSARLLVTEGQAELLGDGGPVRLAALALALALAPERQLLLRRRRRSMHLDKFVKPVPWRKAETRASVRQLSVSQID